MNEKNISVIIPSYNNLRHLKNCYVSLKKHAPNVEMCILSDNSTDGTVEWLSSLEDANLKYLITTERYGIGKGYNHLIQHASTRDIICILHADMIIAPYYFENLLKHLKKKTVVCATRIEPPLHPNGKEKIIKDFGIDFDTLKIEEFETFSIEQMSINRNKTTNGMFAPWVMYKNDFLECGSHDEIFDSIHEDSDIFQRWILNDFKLIQSRDSFVYHLTCRGHRWNKEIGMDDDAYKHAQSKARKVFIRKWGCFMHNDEYQHPIIFPRYKKTLEIKYDSNLQKIYELLDLLEPFFDNVILPSELNIIKEKYVKSELETFNINIDGKFTNETNDITVTISDINSFNNNDMYYISMLPKIIEESGEANSLFVLGNLSIKINNIIDHINELKTI